MATKYEPNSFQKEIHLDDHRFRVAAWHRQAGKTTMAVNELLRWVKDDPGRYWVILPTYRQAKVVFWPMLMSYIPPDWIRKANESSLEMWLVNGSEIALKGAENKDSLRGPTLKGVVLDEYGVMQRDVWSEIIQPTLLRSGGWALFIGTPKGKNHFHTVFNYGNTEKDWKSFHLKASESGLIAEEELERIRKETPETIFNQEYEAEFLDGAGTVFRRIKENMTSVEQPPDSRKVYRVGIDLARTTNFTSISVIDCHTFEQVYIDRFKDLDWNMQRAKIEAVVRRYNDAETIIDATGLGDPVVEELSRLGLPVNGFKYTGEKKKVLVENLAKMLESDRLKLLPNPIQQGELEAFTYTINPETGRYRYHAPEGMFDDMVNALALSVWDIGDKLSEPVGGEQESVTYFENPYTS